jgi:hypothetical protein
MAKTSRFVCALFLLIAALAATAGTPAAAQGTPNCNSSFDAYKVDDGSRAACGITKSPLQQIISLPDGGKEYVYSVRGTKTVMLLPPTGFDPLQATPEQLQKYGYPGRPNSSDAFAAWQKMMSNNHPVPAPRFLASVPFKRQPTVSGTYYLNNWAGYAATTSNPRTYWLAEGYWNEVSLGSSCSGSTELTWAGVGGLIDTILAQDGTAVNVGGLGQHQAWWEIVTATQGSNVTPIPGVYAAAGYGFVALTEWLGSYYQFYVYSYYSGASSTFQVYNNNYAGYSADFVMERGLSNGQYTPLSNFYYLNYLQAWVNGNTSGHEVGHYQHDNIVMLSNDGRRVLADETGLTSYQKFQVNYHNCQ